MTSRGSRGRSICSRPGVRGLYCISGALAGGLHRRVFVCIDMVIACVVGAMSQSQAGMYSVRSLLMRVLVP